jgi:pimeloyl-ACP methyl ester carboxylesterase
VNAHPDLPGNTQDGPANLDGWRGIGEMIALTTDQVVAPVQGMHMAILDRWFGMAGQRFEPARRVVGGLTASAYKTVRLGGSALGSAISIASGLASGKATRRPIWETPKGRYVQSIFNGVWGDRLEAEESSLRIELGLRDLDGSPIPISQSSLSRAFANPSGRLVVLLHGFGETERCWRSDHISTLTVGLKFDGFSVLRLRYNTGRTVADNGSALADLLETVRLEWRIPVEEFALIGHSMGGLVAQSAVGAARSRGHRWADLTTHLVAIGTPHLGSPIEKGVEVISRSLGLFKETRPLAAFLEGRSAGIKDLRHGVDNRPKGVQYHAIAGAVTMEPAHPLGILVGDLVVRVSSALGSSRSHRAVPSNTLVVGGRHHADLLHDPVVTSHIRGWLAPTPLPG